MNMCPLPNCRSSTVLYTIVHSLYTSLNGHHGIGVGEYRASTNERQALRLQYMLTSDLGSSYICEFLSQATFYAGTRLMTKGCFPDVLHVRART